MNRLDICISNDDYSVKYGCSAQSTATTGGFDRLYKRTDTKHHVVTCSTLLSEEDYQYFRAFYLDWQDDPQEFVCKLVLEGYDFYGELLQDYLCSFVKDSVSYSIEAMHFRVSFQLDVFINAIFALTSKPYPIYHKEYVSTNLSVNNVDEYRFTWVETDLDDSVGTSLAVNNAILRDNRPFNYNENVSIGLSVNNVLIRENMIINYSENVGVGISVNNVLLRDPIINNHYESIGIGLTVSNVIVEYI